MQNRHPRTDRLRAVTATTLTSNLGASFELGPTSIRKREKDVDSEMTFADVVRVRAMMLGGGGVLELASSDGRALVVVSSREIGRGSPRLTAPARGESIAFATELPRRLVDPNPSATFVAGGSLKQPAKPGWGGGSPPPSRRPEPTVQVRGRLDLQEAVRPARDPGQAAALAPRRNPRRRASLRAHAPVAAHVG